MCTIGLHRNAELPAQLPCFGQAALPGAVGELLNQAPVMEAEQAMQAQTMS